MKYTNWMLRLLTLSLATFLSVSAAQAQSAYALGAPSLGAYGAASNAASTSAATPDSAKPDDPQSSVITLHARVNEVNVLFIATDKHGKFVRDLNQADFSILDDHQPPQAILNFRRETDLPLHLGLLVDVSGRSTAGLISSATRPPVSSNTRCAPASTRLSWSASTVTA